MSERLRQSVPTPETSKYWECGWVYVMPDFDKPNHSIVEWRGKNLPVYPPRSEQQQTEDAHERADHRA